MFLQSYVVPVCTFVRAGDDASIRELFGTAFFINDEGAFVTAGHVLRNALARSTSTGASVGLVAKGNEGQSPKSIMAPVTRLEFAPAPFDVAIGQVQLKCKTLLAVEPADISEWQDVATYGYPLNAKSGDDTAPALNLRCHKGYIQRRTRPGEIPLGQHPEAFELSFVLSQGLSGAPLFIHRQPKDVVIGVCVGSIRSEIIEDQRVEISEDGKEFRETRLKIDEYGLAHDLRPLHNWCPSIFGGASLLGISRGTDN